MTKISVGILFGGKSDEHEISCRSVMNIIKSIDRDKYDVKLIGIAKNGDWWLFEDDIEHIRNCTWEGSLNKKGIAVKPGSMGNELVILDEKIENVHIDVFFPVLHGHNGEDGTIQGLFEMLNVHYVGCGVFASAAGYDKYFTKRIVEPLGILQARYKPVIRGEEEQNKEQIQQALNEFSFPMFVKPCKAGSSNGVSKVKYASQLEAAINEAFKYDSNVIIEEGIIGREVECAVLDAGVLVVSDVGEIVANNEFYSYDAKYNSTESYTDLSPQLPDGSREKIREYSLKIFRALYCRHLARLDFFLKENGDVVFNEINTLPGFTSISMYPKLIEKAGISQTELIDLMIQSAIKGE